MTTDDQPSHAFSVTRTTLADGRELIYFDDEPDYVSGKKTRKLTDERDLPQAITESELRQDPLTGDWYCYAAHRMNRTFMPPAGENPLAPTLPGQLPTEVPASDYDVVVFENRFPSLSMHMEVPDDFAQTVDGAEIFPRKPALARCEVVCFTPNVSDSFRDLTFTRARTVIEAWAHRTAELSKLEGVRLVFPFENRGKEIGVTLQHPHGQIYSYPYLPPRAAAIVSRAKAHFETTGRDLFEDVLEAEKASGRRIIAEGEYFTAFVPAAAKWPVEVMIMANRAVGGFQELTDAEKDELTAMYLDLLRRIDRFFPGIDKTPYIAAWNQAPVGEDHQFGRLHLQLYSMMRSAGRMKFLAGSESGQGAWISDTTPEAIADRFREVGQTRWLPTRSHKQAVSDVTEQFRRSFGSEPQGVFRAPGRVNLIGEHVDYAGGICLPFALAQSTFAAVGAQAAGDSWTVRVVSDLMDKDDAADGDKPVAIAMSDVGPNSPANWTGYAVGTIWAMREAGLLPADCPSLDIAISSDVPIGSGLSSSAALECSVGVAAFELVHGRAPNDEEQQGIVEAAIRAENEVVGASTGGLDQRISIKGKENHALVIDFAKSSDQLVKAAFADEDLEVLVINTNVRHSLSDGQYATRRGVIDAVTNGLGVSDFRGLDDAVGAAINWAKENVPAEADRDQWVDTVARRVRHVVTEIDRTAQAIEKLSEGDFEAFGTLMVASHLSLRDDYEVSCPELDLAVDVALEQGALGARMTGGGFGGSAIALLPHDRVSAAANAVASAFRDRGMPEPEFFVGNPGPGASRLV